MDDLSKYLDLLFGGMNGYVYAPVKQPDKWTQKFFSWPSESEGLQDWIKTNSLVENSDVYISPAIYSEHKADKAAIKGSKVVWVEFDGKEKINFRSLPIPSAIVQSSLSTHLHCYWEIEPNVKEVVEETNRRLTYYLGADSSGWDSTQLLRPPTSINRKRDLPVRLVSYDKGLPRTLGEFSVAPEVAVRSATIEASQLIKPLTVLTSKTLPSQLIRMVKLESPVEPYRSQFLSKVAYELAEEGLGHLEIVSLLYYVDERIKKYEGRTDRLLRLTQIADMALHKLTVDTQIVIYTPKDILEHVQELTWIFPGWLHSSGQLILSSAPNVGKTQLGLQMLTQLLQGNPFLGKKSFNSTPHTALFLTLEMDVTGLKYVLNHQKDEWDGNFPNERFHIVDEPSTLTRYEDLIDELKATIILVDSLSELFDDVGENPNAEAKKVMRWCRKVRRRYGCAIVLIHHNRKATDSNRKPKGLSDLAGSFQFAKDSDTVIVLWEDHKGIELSTPKVRYGIKETFFIERNENLWFSRVGKDADTKPGPDEPGEDGSSPVDLNFS
jgi:hypothetical protein